MVALHQKTDHPRCSQQKKEPAKPKAGAGKDEDPCRCKEASKMTPGQLLRLMAGDLAFWKKEKKD